MVNDVARLWTPYAATVIAGFLAGTAWPRHRSAPWIAALAVVAGYVIVLVMAGAWYAACPGCAGYGGGDSTRELDFWLAIYGGAVFTFGVLLFIALGAALAAILRRPTT